MAYATTPAIDCSGSVDSVVLRFQRWLGIRSGDSAVVQVSTNGISWTEVWSAGGEVADTQWVSAQYDLTSAAGGQANVYIRWGLSSNPDTRVSYGWNLDGIEILGSGGTLDTQPPATSLNAPDLREGGNPNYAFTVVYTDETAIATASLSDSNLYVVGPHAYSNGALFAGVDDVTDGTPRTASYTIAAPGGAWSEADNGDYEVYVRFNQVLDTSGNAVPAGSLGLIRVDIAPQWALTATVNEPAWGTVSPSGGVYRDGTVVDLTASASNYYTFLQWEGDLSGSNATAGLLMDTNKTVLGVFGELLTTAHPTPYWWLAAYGFTNDFEQAAESMGANGMAVWESYIAGLDPHDPADAFVITNAVSLTNAAVTVFWSPVSGRVYRVESAPGPSAGFYPLEGATNLTWPTGAYSVSATNGPLFLRLGVSLD
jgi:hypothetical protein